MNSSVFGADEVFEAREFYAGPNLRILAAEAETLCPILANLFSEKRVHLLLASQEKQTNWSLCLDQLNIDELRLLSRVLFMQRNRNQYALMLRYVREQVGYAIMLRTIDLLAERHNGAA